MSAVAARGAPVQVLLGVAAVGLLGGGAILALAGAVVESGPWLLGGGAMALAGLGVLVVGGWVDPVAPLLVAAPLPALSEAGGVRVAAVAPVAALVVFASILAWGARDDRWRFGELPLRSGALLLFWWLLAAIASAYPLVAARETLNLLVLVGVLVLSVDHFSRRPASVETAISALVAVAAAVGVLAALEAVGVLPGEFPRFGTRFHRAALGFGQPNGLGLFLAIATPFAALRARSDGPGAWLWRAALVLVVLGLAATFSRGSWFSVVAAIPLLFLAGERKAALGLAAGALVAVVAVDLVSGGMVRDTIERTIGDWILEQRAALVLAGVEMFRANPLFGVGPGGYELALETYALAVPQLVEELPTPHNAYVQLASETGAVGVVAFVGFLAAATWSAARTVHAAARASAERAERGLRMAVLWSTGVVVWAGMFVWPLSHGAGEAVAVVLAMAVAQRPEAGEVAR